MLQEYIDAVKATRERVATITDQMMKVLPQWSLAPVVDCLVALRGIDKISAMVLLAELGDISRFDSPKQLMAYLGLGTQSTDHFSSSLQALLAIQAEGSARVLSNLVAMRGEMLWYS
uniref:Transposase IS116/IS110/IS902 family protein n=1 Tax=Candidatus Kentrum sp. LPFa TaxID=2126335 RepID=A0A450XAQ5_9GAMM|nr:MAG: Transposase IS116/IS110/IS902 family protein [Candidatus Kentron sp. LPFa]VFK36230.1 MAG: Transposase IS116/IS110/IS902 family protein [Candidatus Kentron sp. LPFa]